ncbi:putative dynein light chain Tctex-type [Pavlovales sp. CCMP2436]|nr:putative dynein light chain Tctex-type [Pavlovales sp. CCMP2436]
MDEETEHHVFVAEEVSVIIEKVCKAAIAEQGFLHSKLSQWTATIVENCLKELSALNKPFKYVVTTTLTQKTGASVQTATSQYWDVANDNYVAYKYENDQMQALTTVYGILI